MTVLGFGHAQAQAPEMCRGVAQGAFSLLVLPGAQTRPARDRLAAQLACLHGLDSFVPFAAGSVASLPAAQDWLERNHALALRSLETLRGQGQLTLMAELQGHETAGASHEQTAPGAASQGAGWLRARAQIARGLHSRHAALQTRLEQVVQDLGQLPHKIMTGHRGLRCDLLVPREQAPQIRQAWAHAMAGPHPATAGWQAVLTGAWPAAAFCTQGDMT